MNDYSDIYREWANSGRTGQPQILPPVAPSAVIASRKLPHFRWAAIILGFVLLLLGALAYGQRRLTRVRAEEAQTQRLADHTQRGVAAREIVEHEAAVQKLAAEIRSLTGLAQQEFVRLRGELTPDEQAAGAAALARTEAGEATAVAAAQRFQRAGQALPSASAPEAAQAVLEAKAAREAVERVRADLTPDLAMLHHYAQTVAARHRQAEQVEQQAAQTRAQERLAAAVNRAAWSPGLVVVALFDERGAPAWAAADEVARQLAPRGVAASGRVLTASFFASDLAPALRRGDVAPVLTQLNLPAERLILGRIELNAAPPDANGWTTVDCVGELNVCTADGSVRGTLKWRAAGAGPTPRDGEEQALTKGWKKVDWEHLRSLVAP